MNMTTSTTTETSTTFINQKLQFVEELVLHTSAHIFLTGRAGTGKTTFLKSLPGKTYKRMVVVAPTGVAAINAGGQTIHSFFQLPLGPQIPEDSSVGMSRGGATMQFQKLRREKLRMMRSLDLLIIDEISMVRADVLDAVDAVLRRARRNAKPFGGVQVLMIGDVHQLAPVAKPEEWEVLSPYYKTVYFFGSHVLQQTDYLCVELDHIYRQHDDDFIQILNKVRDNQMDADCIRLLNSRYDPDFKATDGYITLTTHNAQADEINNSRLAAIKNKSFVFKAEVSGIFPASIFPTKDELELKIGAQVMFVKNDPSPEKAYYNGKIGLITDYDEKEKNVVVTCGKERITVPMNTWPNFEYVLNEETQKIEEKEIGQFSQIPLRLAWAVTIHKSQGLTFDKLIVDAHQAFAHGQVYVALSRCTTLNGLVLKTRLSPDTLVNDYMVNSFLNQMPEKEPSQEKVDTLRQAFELDTLLESIDFLEIFRTIGRISQLVHANIPLFDAPTIQELSQRYELIRKEIIDVAIKFDAQIRQLHAKALYDDNPPLQERMKAAAAYFQEHILQHYDAIQKLTFKTDNKAVNDLLKDYLGQLQETIAVKTGCLESFKGGLSLSEYYKLKASKLLEVEKQQRPNKLRDYPSERKDLYGILRSWRDDVAEEADVELYAVIPNKTLKAIAEAKPLTKSALRKVEGMGPKRMSAFADELLTIVRKYVGTDVSTVEEEPEEEPKPKTSRKIGETYEITRDMFEKGMNVEEIAAERQLALSTIYGHLSRFVANGIYPANKFVPQEKCDIIKEYFTEVDDTSLSEARNVLGDDFSYGELRIVLAEWEFEQKQK